MDDMVLDTFHLFAGAGGGLLADQLLGHRIVGAVEIEAYPRKVLLARQLDGSLPGFPIWDDVTTFRADNPDCAGYIERLRALPNLCISGGFPCQDISAAGKGAGIEGERSGMWKESKRIISEIMPRYVFVENSPMLTVRGLGVVLRDLAEMGFDAEWGVLSAADCEGSHLRERFWLIAYANLCGQSREKKRSFRLSGLKTLVDVKRNWHDKSMLYRTSYELADRVDRLKAIGNGQVPRVAATAFELLRERLEA